MEKLRAHYDLEEIKRLILLDKFSITNIAIKNADKDFGLSYKEIPEIVKILKNTDLYKSMTVNNNNKLWQDVYHKEIFGEIAYIKLQIIDNDSIIIQFKRK